MKRKSLAVLFVLVALAVAVSPVSAVQYGEPDVNNEYPWVGLMVALYDGQPLWRCTGSLISSTLFLTAGHCVGYDPDLDVTPDQVEIWFDVGPIPTDPDYNPELSCAEQPEVGYPCNGDASGTPYANPDWTGGLTIPDTHDVGVVVLDEPYELDEYGDVAPVGYLDDLATRRGRQDVTFTVVGYGLQLVKPVQLGERTRYVGTVELINLRSALTDGFNLHYTSNPGEGRGGSGGTCFGDSGGPVIHDGYIVGVNSFVLNSNCKGAGFAYRVDTIEVQDFIFAYGSD